MKFKFDHYILFVTVLLVGAAIYFSWSSTLSRAIRNGDMLNGLIIGTDLVDNARHSDTLVFASYNPEHCFLNIISIPRDTRFSPPGYQFRKINEIYAYHYRKTKNDDTACKELQSSVRLLFQNKVSIPYYLQVNYAAFIKVIDLLGGVTIDIDEPMNYDDNAGNLHINFEAGIQNLNGKQALEYVRYRGKAGDIGRVFRQQRFFKAMLSKVKKPSVLFRLPQILFAMTREVKTNLSFWDMIVISLELKELKSGDIRLAQLPGKTRRDYWEIDTENCISMLDNIFTSTDIQVSTGPKMRVEVWNASGKNGLADKINWILRKQGYDVVEWGTYSTRQKKSLIKDLTGDLRSAQNLSKIINCGEVVTRYDAKRFVDISVILGEDCNLDKIVEIK